MTLPACLPLFSAWALVSVLKGTVCTSQSLPRSVSHLTQLVLQQTVSRTIHVRPTAAVNNSRSVVNLSTKAEADRRLDVWMKKEGMMDGSS